MTRLRWRWWWLRATAHEAVTVVLRLLLTDRRIAHRNSDKPHRCPGCHAVECGPPKRFYRLYVCAHCGTRHWPGWRWQREGTVCLL